MRQHHVRFAYGGWRRRQRSANVCFGIRSRICLLSIYFETLWLVVFVSRLSGGRMALLAIPRTAMAFLSSPTRTPQKLNACPGTKHGLTCDIACKEGFAIHGFARATCNFGTFTSLPACAEEGQKILREKVVTGYLIFSADSADHLEGHATSTAFLEVLLDRQNFHFEFRIQI